jgi:type I restriction enzyme R subunit
MPDFNEHALEMAIMELFEQQGYSYTNGETIHKELSEVLLRDDLQMKLTELQTMLFTKMAQ